MAHTIVWSDVPVVDIDRAVQFYGGVLGVKVVKQQHEQFTFAVFDHGDKEVSCCLVVWKDKIVGDQGPLLYFNVDGRLDEAVVQTKALGGKVLQERHSIGPYGFRALVLDSEGNRIALHSTK